MIKTFVMAAAILGSGVALSVPVSGQAEAAKPPCRGAKVVVVGADTPTPCDVQAGQRLDRYLVTRGDCAEMGGEYRQRRDGALGNCLRTDF